METFIKFLAIMILVENALRMKLQSGHVTHPLEGTELKKQEKDWGGYKNGLVRLIPGRWLFLTRMEALADRIYKFKFKESDVLLMTYPKCGTTWTQEVIWTMRNNPNLDNPKADLRVSFRAPFIELDTLLPQRKPGDDSQHNYFLEVFKKSCPGKDPADGVTLQMAEASPDPRTLKTHLPFSLLTPSLLDTTKVVYVARNPKDVIISYHHHSRIFKLHNYVGSFEDFVQYFIDGDLVYGSYWLNLKEAWEKKDHPNLHFMFYEDMKANPVEEFKKLDTFLGTNLTQKQLEDVVEYCSFGAMKERSKAPASGDSTDRHFVPEITKADGGFFRKGESGDWKGKFTPDLEAKVDEWIKKNIDGFGINFKYGV